jgi:hypothetical protein
MSKSTRTKSRFQVTKIVTIDHDEGVPEWFLRGIAMELPFDRVGAHIHYGGYSARTLQKPIRARRLFREDQT